MEIDTEGWLKPSIESTPQIAHVPSSRTTALEKEDPLGIIWHWTAGVCNTPNFARNLADSIRSYHRESDRPASWHVLVAKNGDIFQSVPFLLGSWHVGRGGQIDGTFYANVNKVTVGVELENSGKLEKFEGKYYCWPYWLDPDAAEENRQPDPRLLIAEERVTTFEGQFYDAFTEAQIASAAELLRALVITYKWQKPVCSYGHVDFDPIRKQDPGPVWKNVVMPGILDGIFGTDIPQQPAIPNENEIA